jgi:hypothetical protein
LSRRTAVRVVRLEGLSVGNAETGVIGRLLIEGKPRIETLVADPEESLLILQAP